MTDKNWPQYLIAGTLILSGIGSVANAIRAYHVEKRYDYLEQPDNNKFELKIQREHNNKIRDIKSRTEIKI